MRVNLVLPSPASTPVGGYKILYQYADALQRRGHVTTVVHGWSTTRVPRRLWVRYLGRRVLAGTGLRPVAPWYRFEEGVRVLIAPSLASGGWAFPAAEVTVLTSWLTSALVPESVRLGRLAQVVADYEIWMVADADQRVRMASAFCRPGVTRFAASSAVESMLRDARSDYVGRARPGIDLNLFQQTVPMSDRRLVVGFPLRDGPHKGMDVVLAALDEVRCRIPSVEVTCFGAADRCLPTWVAALGPLSPVELVDWYNRCAVFVLPSLYEGFGLPALEAMACGAAVVCTYNGGVADFAVDGRDAVLVEPGSVLEIVTAVEQLLASEQHRESLAAAGVESSRQHGIDEAADCFAIDLERLCSPPAPICRRRASTSEAK